MDETNGLKFIEILKKDKEKFRKEVGVINCFKSTLMGFKKKLYMICYVMKINI